MPIHERHPEPALSGDALRRAVRESVGKHVDLSCYQVFLFGSEATHTSDRASDIDVGVLGPSPIPGAVVERIRQELQQLRTLRVFDVVDFCGVDSSFRVQALEHAERL